MNRNLTTLPFICLNECIKNYLENDLVVSLSHGKGYQQNFWKTPFRSGAVDKILDSVISVTTIEDAY